MAAATQVPGTCCWRSRIAVLSLTNQLRVSILKHFTFSRDVLAIETNVPRYYLGIHFPIQISDEDDCFYEVLPIYQIFSKETLDKKSTPGLPVLTASTTIYWKKFTEASALLV
jgi:hypothetical protein